MEKGENLELEKLYLTMLLHLWMNTLISLLKGIYSVQKRKKNLHAFDTCKPENLHAQKKKPCMHQQMVLQKCTFFTPTSKLQKDLVYK